MKNIKVSVVVNLTNQLGEVGRTKGPLSPEFGQILVNLNREYKRIPHVKPSRLRVNNQANGSTSGGIVVFPKIPSDPCKP